MNYSQMSDFEINCAVADALGREFFSNEKPDDSGRRRKSYEIDGKHRDVCESGWTSELFDPCKSWADAGLIIQGSKISINAHGLQTWMAWKNTGSDLKEITSNRHQHSFISESPLRSAMVVFLMIQEKPDAA